MEGWKIVLVGALCGVAALATGCTSSGSWNMPTWASWNGKSKDNATQVAVKPTSKSPLTPPTANTNPNVVSTPSVSMGQQVSGYTKPDGKSQNSPGFDSTNPYTQSGRQNAAVADYGGTSPTGGQTWPKNNGQTWGPSAVADRRGGYDAPPTSGYQQYDARSVSGQPTYPQDARFVAQQHGGQPYGGQPQIGGQQGYAPQQPYANTQSQGAGPYGQYPQGGYDAAPTQYNGGNQEGYAPTQPTSGGYGDTYAPPTSPYSQQAPYGGQQYSDPRQYAPADYGQPYGQASPRGADAGQSALPTGLTTAPGSYKPGSISRVPGSLASSGVQAAGYQQTPTATYGGAYDAAPTGYNGGERTAYTASDSPYAPR